MDLLGLDLIGWLFSICSAIALALGIVITTMHYRSEEGRKYLRNRILDDVLLFAIWLTGLAGGIGVLLGRAWSRPTLEFFCWVLMVLLLMSGWSRLRAAPPPRNMHGIRLALFVLPIMAVCIATIVTLRGETAFRVLAG
jgi:hypothetical protein